MLFIKKGIALGLWFLVLVLPSRDGCSVFMSQLVGNQSLHFSIYQFTFPESRKFKGSNVCKVGVLFLAHGISEDDHCLAKWPVLLGRQITNNYKNVHQ